MYYGNKKIANITDTDDGRKLLSFEDGTSVTLSALLAAVAITPEISDDSKLREARCFPVVKDILETMFKWDIHIGEVDFVLRRVSMSIEASMEQATNILWNAPQSGHQNMSDVDSVLKGKVNADLVKVPDEGPAADEAAKTADTTVEVDPASPADSGVAETVVDTTVAPVVDPTAATV